MKLMLNQLQTLAKQTLVEGKILEALQKEVRSVFGPSVITEGTLSEIAYRVNDHLETRRCLGDRDVPTFRVAVLARLIEHQDTEVRCMVARLLPERFLTRMKNDADGQVRSIVARRVPVGVLFEMCRRYPHDDQLNVIRKERILTEGVDLETASALSKATQQKIAPELSDVWYETAARKMLADYGEFSYGTPRSLEHGWNPLAIRQYCDNVKATTGVVIDRARLQKAVDEMIAELEATDPTYKGTLLDLMKALREQVEVEKTLAETKIFDILDEDSSPEARLTSLTASTSSGEYVTRFESVYNVIKADIPTAIRKYRLGEGLTNSTKIPMKAVVGQLNERVEKSLDRYVKSWNEQQAFQGEPFKIDWCIDPTDSNNVCFEMELK